MPQKIQPLNHQFLLNLPTVSGEEPVFDALAEKKYTTHPIIRQIIDRECHVGLSDRAVFRLVISRLVEGYKTYRSMPRESRRQLLQECIDIHRYNRAEYQAVMYPSYE